jgi:hypothetical protein
MHPSVIRSWQSKRSDNLLDFSCRHSNQRCYLMRMMALAIQPNHQLTPMLCRGFGSRNPEYTGVVLLNETQEILWQDLLGIGLAF